jgi:hypothetical protein
LGNDEQRTIAEHRRARAASGRFHLPDQLDAVLDRVHFGCRAGSQLAVNRLRPPLQVPHRVVGRGIRLRRRAFRQATRRIRNMPIFENWSRTFGGPAVPGK